MIVLYRMNRRPREFNSIAYKHILEAPKLCLHTAHLAGEEFAVDTAAGKKSCGLTNVPFNWMEPVTAVCDVRDAKIFACWQQIVHADRNQAAQWNLEGQGRDIDIMAVSRAWMQVNSVAAYADGIGELLCFTIGSAGCAYMLLQYGKLGFDPP